MNKLILTTTIGTASLILSSCSGSGKSPTNTPPENTATTSEVKVTTISGVQTSLDGSYVTGCHDSSGGNSTEEFLTIAGSVWTYSAKRYIGNATCTGSPATDQEVVATLTATTGADKAIVGWLDGDKNAVPAPTAADASGSLSDTEAYTPMTIVVTNSEDSSIPVGTTNTNLYYIVDDKGAKLRLYRDSDATHAGNFDFWDQQ